ncbi:MATE family efflux transporter, partial [Nanoarchaeota archaeon]
MKKSRLNEFLKNPKKALFKLAIPMMIGMLVQALYNVVDTAYIGHLGAEPLAALTFAFPLFFVLISLMVGISTGMSSRISRFIGEKKKAAAENTAMHAILLSIVVGVLVSIFALIFLEDIFSLFGASNSVLILSQQYMSIILYGQIFMFLSFLISHFYQAQGDAKTSMIIHISSLVLNMILDPIFIYALDLGVK